MTVRLPSRLKVGQSEYSVSIAVLKKTLLGQTKMRPQEIRIDPNQGEHSMRDTMLHEALHAVFHESSALTMLDMSHDDEEKVVRLLTPWLLMLLCNNPELIAYLTAPVEVS